jgi:hypothetical protein
VLPGLSFQGFLQSLAALVAIARPRNCQHVLGNRLRGRRSQYAGAASERDSDQNNVRPNKVGHLAYVTGSSTWAKLAC